MSGKRYIYVESMFYPYCIKVVTSETLLYIWHLTYWKLILTIQPSYKNNGNLSAYITQKYWNENVILTKFSSLTTLEVFILTTPDVVSDENIIKMTTFRLSEHHFNLTGLTQCIPLRSGIVRQSYLNCGNFYPGKTTSLYWDGPLNVLYHLHESTLN